MDVRSELKNASLEVFSSAQTTGSFSVGKFHYRSDSESIAIKPTTGSTFIYKTK